MSWMYLLVVLGVVCICSKDLDLDWDYFGWMDGKS